MLRIAVCVSGGGTNLGAIFKAIDNGIIKNGEIVKVISNNANAYALTRAKERNVEAVCISPKSYPDRETFNEALLSGLKEADPDLIVLAGFLVNVPAIVVSAFKNRIINIHPALIPSFCGKGYYGLKVHEAVLARGVKVTGATVHFANEIPDGGRIIMQKAVKIRDDDTPEVLQKRVMEQAEWKILPAAAEKVCRDIVKNRKQ